MICPFRVDVELEYVSIGPDKDGDPQYLEKSQRQKYALCDEGECPFFVYPDICSRANALVND